MAASLNQRLAERLGCTPEAAEAALRQFVEQLQQQLEKEGQATVSGLGRFVRTEQGLQFEPDISLAQVVNHRFAGLEPVTVEPPSAQPYRKTEVVQPEGEAEKAEPSPFYEIEEEQRGAPPTSEMQQETVLEPEPEPAPPSEDEPEPEAEAAAAQAPPPPPGEPSLRPPHPPRIRVEEERRRGLPVWIPGALLVVVLGVVGVWFLFFSQPSAPETSPPPPPRTEAEQAMPPETTATAVPPATPDTTPSAETPRAETPLPPPPVIGNYALIVGSVTSRNAAEQIAERYRRALSEQRLPVTIVTTTTNGTTRYRVAVGRYNSPEDALAAKRQLGNVLPPDAWVLRLPSMTP